MNKPVFSQEPLNLWVAQRWNIQKNFGSASIRKGPGGFCQSVMNYQRSLIKTVSIPELDSEIHGCWRGRWGEHSPTINFLEGVCNLLDVIRRVWKPPRCYQKPPTTSGRIQEVISHGFRCSDTWMLSLWWGEWSTGLTITDTQLWFPDQMAKSSDDGTMNCCTIYWHFNHGVQFEQLYQICFQ